MDQEKLNKKREMLETKEKRIKNQKKLLKNNERKIKTSRYIHLGQLFEKAGFNVFDEKLDAPLLGALLEIKEQLAISANKARWILKQKRELPNMIARFSISFKSPPSENELNSLKNLNFKWRENLQSWNGLAKHKDIEAANLGEKATVEVVK